MINSTLNTEATRVVRLPVYDKAHPGAPAPGADNVSSQAKQRAAALLRAQAGRKETALMVFQINEYGQLTEAFGEKLGLELSQAVAARLHAHLREADLVQQVANDEFVIVAGNLERLEDVAEMARRLLEVCAGAYDLAYMTPHVKASVGIALHPSDGEQAEDLLRFARIAARRAAQANKTHYHFFSQDLLKREQQKVWMKTELERALKQNRLVLHYQPQYAVGSHTIVGVEALVRMVTESGELVLPDKFIPVAEDSGLIIPLGRWVIQEACRQMAEWRAAGCSLPRMAVNVSPLQLADESLVELISATIEKYGLQYSDLELEITERCMVDWMCEEQCALSELSEKGVRVAIDDFGTGYSSFAYLAHLPLSMLKMDRSFLAEVCSDTRSEQVVAAMITMARGLGLEVIAEGIETAQQYEFLQQNGCDFGQGFGLAKPQPATQLQILLQGSSDWSMSA
jgi:diguanylate cyclase (GGDEF)-like protein